MREALLLDLGAIVFELHRQNRREPELLQAKAAELTAVDNEVRALADALASDGTVHQLVAAGIAGTCSSCGALMATDARFCSSCGVPASRALTAERVPSYTEEMELRRTRLRTRELREPEPAEHPAPEPETVAEEEIAEEPVEGQPAAAETADEEHRAAEESVDEPVAEEPVAEEVVAEEAAAEEPVSEEAVSEEPVSEEPVSEELAAEPPAPEEPPWGRPLQGSAAARPASGSGPGPSEAPGSVDGADRRSGEALQQLAGAVRTGLDRGRRWLEQRRRRP